MKAQECLKWKILITYIFHSNLRIMFTIFFFKSWKEVLLTQASKFSTTYYMELQSAGILKGTVHNLKHYAKISFFHKPEKSLNSTVYNIKDLSLLGFRELGNLCLDNAQLSVDTTLWVIEIFWMKTNIQQIGYFLWGDIHKPREQ